MNTPIPRDIPLPLPAPTPFLEVLLILAFIAHILFVNLMVGGSLLVFALQLRARAQRDFDAVAHTLAATVTVNKSLAVVLGVAPLLLINVLYTVHFYTANALTGLAWFAIVPLVSIAFLLLYLHKYSWARLAGQPTLHLAILGVAVAILLVIPLIFLANVNLMMMPERWTSTHGFIDALLLPNVLPRYAHFTSASLVMTSLFCVAWFGRVDVEGSSLPKHRLRRFFYSVAFVVSLAQFVIGPIVLLTVPTKAMHVAMVIPILAGAIAAVPATWMMGRELLEEEVAGRRLKRIVGLLSLTVVAMASGRHISRGVALVDHKKGIAAATEQFQYDSEQAAFDAQRAAAAAADGVSEGEQIFTTTCAGCHAIDKPLVGPSVVEIVGLYADNPKGIVTWASAPGKKREGPQMPAFGFLGEQKLGAVATWMLSVRAKPPAP